MSISETFLHFSICLNIFAYYSIISILSNQNSSVASLIILISAGTTAVLSIFGPTTVNIYTSALGKSKKKGDEYSLKDLELINKYNLQLFLSKTKRKWFDGPNVILYVENSTNINSHLHTSSPSSSTFTNSQSRSGKLMEMKGFIMIDEFVEAPISDMTAVTTSDSP